MDSVTSSVVFTNEAIRASLSGPENDSANNDDKIKMKDKSVRGKGVVACNIIHDEHGLLFDILCSLSWRPFSFVPLTNFALFQRLPAELRSIIWKFACNSKPTTFIPFFWDPYTGLYNDDYTDSYTGPKCDSIASILLATSESRAEALKIYIAVKLPSFLQDSSLMARPETMYVHPSIDVAWICEPRSRGISDIFQTAMLLQPESIPIPEVADRLTAYMTEILTAGVKRVCFDMDTWTNMVDNEVCYSALEKAVGGFHLIIVDGDHTICEGSWEERWVGRAGRAMDGWQLDASANLWSTMLDQILLDHDKKFRDLVEEKGWVVGAEVVWSGTRLPSEMKRVEGHELYA
ncbi:hypothetical protein DL98DRAFT_649197 [Cadophora sp. DSE1049]|nr:hypothetical protein DL98DRAFT_649197 [Cadophora sp. DSE1049]